MFAFLNFARGDLVNNTDLLKALSDGKVAAYATDFPNDALLGVENVLAIPHLGASTPESEDNCACMAADEIKDYLENAGDYAQPLVLRHHMHRITRTAARPWYGGSRGHCCP